MDSAKGHLEWTPSSPILLVTAAAYSPSILLSVHVGFCIGGARLLEPKASWSNKRVLYICTDALTMLLLCTSHCLGPEHFTTEDINGSS